MCPITTSLAVLAALAALIYIFLTWNFNYWKKRGIKSAQAWPLLGSFPSVFTLKRNMAYDQMDIYRKYKDTDNIVGVMNTRIPQLLILSPDYCNKVFVNDFRSFHDNEMGKFINRKSDQILGNNAFVLNGEEWKMRRAEITPALTASRSSASYPVTLSVCSKFVDYIKRQTKIAPSSGLDAKDISLCYSTEVVTDCVLGISAKSFSDNPTPIKEKIKKVFEQSFGFLFFTFAANLWPPITRIFSMRFFSLEAEQFFYDLMQQAVDLRRQSGSTDRLDFLNYILHLQEKKNLSKMQLVAHTMTFLTDGFETTSLVLAHVMLLLGRNPEAQRILREEAGKEQLSFDQLSELPYLDACIHETLRMFPPLLSGRKIVTEPYDFVNKDGVSVRVLPDDVVIVPVYSLHYDSDYYEDPELFKPERFLEANGGVRKYRDQGLYYGFGNGPRVCLGMRFALTQLKAAVVEVVRHLDIKVNPKTRKDNRLDDKYFMATLKGGIWLDFEPRD